MDKKAMPLSKISLERSKITLQRGKNSLQKGEIILERGEISLKEVRSRLWGQKFLHINTHKQPDPAVGK